MAATHFRCARRIFREALAPALVVLAAAGCLPRAVEIESPRSGALVDDATVAVEVRVARTLDPTSAEVRLDGVELIAALGLAPPFAGAGGVVTIGGTPVAISDFDYEVPSLDPVRLRFRAAGLAPGAHAVEALAIAGNGVDSVQHDTTFTVVGPFALVFDTAAVSGGGPITPLFSPSRRIARSTFGDPLAGSAAAPGVGAVDTGFFSAAQALQP